jgi:hypothetical protein
MKTLLPAALLAALLSGCAGIGAQGFYANPSAASPFEMCKTLVTGAPDMDFANALRMELGRRGVAESSCPGIIKQRETLVTAGVAAGVVALAVAASRHSDVSGHHQAARNPGHCRCGRWRGRAGGGGKQA